MSESN